jgi:hypothetical protein
VIAHVAFVDCTPEQAEEAARRIAEGTWPILSERKGYRGSIFLIDRAREQAMTVALWESDEARAAADAAWPQDQPGCSRRSGSADGARRSSRCCDSMDRLADHRRRLNQWNYFLRPERSRRPNRDVITGQGVDDRLGDVVEYAACTAMHRLPSTPTLATSPGIHADRSIDFGW